MKPRLPPPKDQRGFTILEVVLALVILTVVIMGITSATGNFMRVVSISDRETAAIQLAEDRIEQIQMDPNYGGLDTVYVGTESNLPTLTGYTRLTDISRVGGLGQATDHKLIQVTINGPGLSNPVSRSVTVAAP